MSDVSLFVEAFYSYDMIAVLAYLDTKFDGAISTR